jgi:hypothetical protein
MPKYIRNKIIKPEVAFENTEIVRIESKPINNDIEINIDDDDDDDDVDLTKENKLNRAVKRNSSQIVENHNYELCAYTRIQSKKNKANDMMSQNESTNALVYDIIPQAADEKLSVLEESTIDEPCDNKFIEILSQVDVEVKEQLIEEKIHIQENNTEQKIVNIEDIKLQNCIEIDNLLSNNFGKDFKYIKSNLIKLRGSKCAIS